MKKTVAGLIAVAVLALAWPAIAEVGTIDFSVTNKATANNTTTGNVGNSVAVTSQDRAGLMLKMQGDGSGTGNVTLTFARSADNSNWETTPRFTWTAALNNTTAVVACTNLDNTIVGAFGYLKVISIANADGSVNATNFSLTLTKKTIKPSP
jgi:hypothetical protein